MDTNSPRRRSLKTIKIPEGKKVHIIKLGRITHFEAVGKCTQVHFVDKTSILSTRMMKHYHELLHEKGFYRIHRKYLINMENIVSYDEKSGRITLYSDPIPLIHYGEIPDSVN
jgi:two-component system LytT family response regulator